MLKLVTPGIVPPGGIRFVDPDTGFQYNDRYLTLDALKAHVDLYRKQNHLPPILEFQAVWENWVCQEPLMNGKCCGVSAAIARTFDQYIKGAKAWVRTKLKAPSERFVRQDVAEARAKTCVQCKENLQNVGHSHSQLYSNQYMESQIGKRQTSSDGKLFTCRICTCILRAKVHYRSDVIAKSLSANDIAKLQRNPRSITGKPIQCWQLTSLEKVKAGTDGDEAEIETKAEEAKAEISESKKP